MGSFTVGQTFKLRKDIHVNIDDVENGGSAIYLITSGTQFTIKLIEDFIDVYFDGYGIGVFTEEELLQIL